jgi:sugar lactone lactonase YvrE
MKLAISKMSANLLPSRSLMGSMAIGSISLLSGALGFCPDVLAGVLYVSDAGAARRISTISATGVVTPFATGLEDNGAIGLAFDKDGYLYTSIYASNIINKISPDGKTVTVFADASDGVNGPYGLAFDKDGTLFQSNVGYPTLGTSTINKISPDGTSTPFVTSTGGLNLPVWLAFAPDGTLLESDRRSGKINKISTDGTVTPFVTGLAGPYGLAFDKKGTLYVADGPSGTIKTISSDGTASVFASGFTTAYGIAFDESDNLFVTDPGNFAAGVGSIVKIGADGVRTNNFVTAANLNLPLGLVFGPDVPTSSTAVPEPFTIVGTLIGGTAALRLRKKLQARPTDTNR